MAETKSLAASVRDGVGKGAARRVRREGRIPGVIYGGGEPPTPIALSWQELNKLIYAGGFKTTTFEIDVDGEKERVIPRDYQLDPVKGRAMHVDFLRLQAGQKISVEIPVHATGQEDSLALKTGGVVEIVRHTVPLTVPADAIPEQITIDVSKLAVGDSVHLSELKLPRGTRLALGGTDDLAVLAIKPPVAEVVDEPVEAPIEATESADAEEAADAASDEGAAGEKD